MAMVRAFEDDNYCPEYSLLVILDPRVAWDPDEEPEIPRHRDRGDSPTGTFAGTGAGWITCQAGGEADHEVRLELHDAPPPADHADFDDVLEAPYRASSGGLTLTSPTGGVGRADFDLGAAGWFRVRVARRRAGTGDWPSDQWLLRFWPDPAREPPVWLARSTRAGHRGLAEDLEAVLRWTPRTPLETTSAALAERLLISEPDLRDALAAAEQDGLLYADRSRHAAGQRADREEPLRLWLGRRPGPEQAEPAKPTVPTRQTKPPEPALTAGLMVSAVTRSTSDGPGPGFAPRSRRKPAGPPFGSPPRAGVVETNGAVVVWRDGVRVELARLGRAEWKRAWETTQGVLVVAYGRPAWLVSPDGDVIELDDVRMPGLALMGDGRRVVVQDSEHRRRASRYRLRVIDLAGGPAETMPWSQDREIGLLGTHRNTVFFSDRHDPAAPTVTMRWTPGTEPERYERRIIHVDPLTGTTSTRTAEGVMVYRPDGTAVTVPVPLKFMAQLAPGGDRLWTVRGYPPEFMLFPVEAGPEVRPQVWQLPWDGHSFADKMYGKPIWEDEDHVLLGHQPAHIPPEPATGIRLSVPDGTTERLPPTGSTTRTAMLVEPFHPTRRP